MTHTSLLGSLRTAASGLLLLGVVAAACNTPDLTFSEALGGSGGTAATANVGTTGVDIVGGAGGMPADHCDNDVADSTETDVNCGGPACPPCAVGERCSKNSDCANQECTAGRCRDASCMDEEINGTETDLDCGGENCPRCPAGRICMEDSDCESDRCVGRRCQEASCSDRKQNGTETDVDCGGECPGCDVGQACVVEGDCLLPPTVDNESADCNEHDECELVCGTGSADCNHEAEDGCETNLQSSLAHCGACDVPCDLANAETQCQGGQCLIVDCLEGFANCNLLPEDGCEVELAIDPGHCGECNLACSDHNGRASCQQGVCAIECDVDFADCNDDVADGCEANLNRSVDHCQQCSESCQVVGGELTAFCDGDGDGCGATLCAEPGLGDCDGDGECTDQLDSIEDCGRCGNACHVPHGVPACSDGACLIDECVIDDEVVWEDCDGSLSNGCERNLNSDRSHCGACDNDCTDILGTDLHVTDVGCAAGVCLVVSCEAGFADCDGDFENGCEVDTSADLEHCGGCNYLGGVDCSREYPNGTGRCQAASCVFEECNQGYGDCNQDAPSGARGNGCETNLVSNDEHCGACGVECLTGVGTSSNACDGSRCSPVCQLNYGDCDAMPNNGCETSLLSDQRHCGACNSACQEVNGDNQCVAGVCEPACDADYLSCDADPANGCEQAVTRNINHCGACDDRCSGSNGGTASCSAGGECTVACPVSGNYRSCNDEDSARDGCETNIGSDPDHCGGCNQRCAGNNVTTRSCNAGTCVPSCESGFCPAPDPAEGCTSPIGTRQNCAACGDVCTAPEPFCEDAGGYRCSAKSIEVVNTGTGTSQAANGLNVLSVNHDLQGVVGDYRMVLIGVSAFQQLGAPSAVYYAGSGVGAPVVSELTEDTWVGIYRALETSLPGPGSHSVSVQFAVPQWGWAQLDVVELAGVDQNAPIHTSAALANANDCAGTSARNSVVNFSGIDGSFVYALLSGRAGTNAVLQTSGFETSFNEASSSLGGNSNGYMAAVIGGPRSSGATISWNFSNCNQSVGAAVGIQRAESL